MKSSHLTVMVFCHVLLASIVFYFTSSTLASPLHKPAEVKQQPQQPLEAKQQIVHPPAIAVADPKSPVDLYPQARSAPPADQLAAVVAKKADPEKTVQAAPAPIVAQQPALTERKAEEVAKVVVDPSKNVEAPPAHLEVAVPKVEQAKPVVEPMLPQGVQAAPDVAARGGQSPWKRPKPAGVPQAAALVASAPPSIVQQDEVSVVAKEDQAKPVVNSPVVPVASEERKLVEQSPVVAANKNIDSQASQQQAPPTQIVETKMVAPPPVVMGGLGPLHLLATTLCSYQPDKLVADEHLNQLYARRASVRKSLFEFMSLKFTNLEKLSSRLGYGLQVVPVKSQLDLKSPSVTPSHGWPVVGKCTAYDLKLMGEAAWCECHEGDLGCPSKSGAGDKSTQVGASMDEQPPKITSNQHAVSKTARSIPTTYSFLPSPDESSVISKLLHVSDLKDAPTVESTIYNLNLTQHQLATLEAHATSTQECRRNALRYTKALFNHLAEDQREVSESWPRLYGLISNDDCARKRMIDIVSALSGFRTDTTSIRRDNLEFAFAMDDLRAKVLESEVNVPLTFDRHFIEVEQFLQQSVRLMLANIQPKRAKLTSMRYRSLMYGASQQAADDQCIDLHQRLLARNYPNDCNPTQFGQLPDVLRMTASSLELWSIEKELSLHMAKVTDYPNSSAVGQQKVKADVNECIANLVSS